MRVELPPRARRILERSVSRRGLHGTTSACAENTWYTAYGWFQNRNYLRVRGEYRIWIFPTCAMMELPPRARRIPQGFGLGSSTPGTTSACAENTAFLIPKTRYLWNYLRVRGEYFDNGFETRLLMELPPRARRIRAKLADQWTDAGTTSACAENTCYRSSRGGKQWNYLRVRGEYLNRNEKLLKHQELPPRARRIPFRPCQAPRFCGTTSACAENTHPNHSP